MEVAWLLVAKFVALTLLWYAFFGPAHRPSVDGAVASRQLGIVTVAGERK